MTVIASVDYDECASHGTCARLAPEIFRLDENGNVEVLLEEVPAELEAKAMLAMRQCPTNAISVAEI